MKTNRSGFTLFELVVTLFIICTGMLGFILSNINIQKVSDYSYEKVVAAQDAHRVLELMRNASATGNFPRNVTSAFPNGSNVAGINNLSGEQVSVIYADPLADPLDITVTTNWREGGRRNTSFQLRTLMTQRG